MPVADHAIVVEPQQGDHKFFFFSMYE
jgi:hypothetical protein